LPKILELEQHVADLIAAGEVVQRPASVVKELVENSIDSGASIITVEINSGGMTFIRVTDNGCGIAAADVKTAFLRHATSKLRDATGLEAIGTLGFRGEALAAIAAVSRIELLTREAGAGEGVTLTLEAGEVVNMAPAGCPEGTTIIVRDLFFNTPARLKFLKSDRAEGSSVASVVLRCALSRPDISVRFIKDGKTENHTPGDSRVDSCIYSLLGRDIEAGFLSAETSDDIISVKGYISSPEAARGNRSYQFFFVNGRAIRSLLLQSALEQAYRNNLPSGKFPSCVLFITTKLSDVDVNVHPAKTEIKFMLDKQVFDGVYYAALGALERARLNTGAEKITQEVILGGDSSTIDSAIGERREVRRKTKIDEFSGGFKSMQADVFRETLVSEASKAYGTRDKSSPKSQPFTMDSRAHLDPTVHGRTMRVPMKETASEPLRRTQLSSSDAQGEYRVIGEALNVYIIVEYQNSVWFIDKHAAHERIHFDALKNDGYEPMSESLITPVICRFGHEDATLLLENEAFLHNLGFSVESFGDDAVAIRYIPADIDIGDVESVLSDICPQLRYSGKAETSWRDSIYRMIACKAAIKAGRLSGKHELESLASRVLSGEVSRCPHGRPVMLEMTKFMLDKNMGRI